MHAAQHSTTNPSTRKSPPTVMRRFSTLASSSVTATANFITQPTWKSHPHLLARNEVIPGTRIEHFQSRIARLCALLPATATVLIPSFKTKYASQNIFYPFQQNNNMYYLTGFNEPDSCLVIEKDATGHSVSMFVMPNDEHSMLWSGPRAGLDGVRSFFGIQQVYEQRKLSDLVNELVRKRPAVFVDYVPDSSSLDSALYMRLKPFASPLAEIMQSLRLVKTTEERALLQKSAEIASRAFDETMRHSQNATSENELAARMEYECRTRGAERLAYVPVVAGSDRGLVLHYTHNNQLLDRRGLVLMDAGASYCGYASDITRTWPLNGRFSAPQRKLYEAVLNVQLGCLHALQTVPAISMAQLNDVSVYLTCIELDRLGFRNAERHVHRLYPHSIGHHLGLDLHDCPTHDSNQPLQPGNVITVEPGLYVPPGVADFPTEFHGLAVRIEDDVVIEADNRIVLLTSVPKTVEEIERHLAAG